MKKFAFVITLLLNCVILRSQNIRQDILSTIYLKYEIIDPTFSGTTIKRIPTVSPVVAVYCNGAVSFSGMSSDGILTVSDAISGTIVVENIPVNCDGSLILPELKFGTYRIELETGGMGYIGYLKV